VTFEEKKAAHTSALFKDKNKGELEIYCKLSRLPAATKKADLTVFSAESKSESQVLPILRLQRDDSVLMVSLSAAKLCRSL
jgi:hypothetical protein